MEWKEFIPGYEVSTKGTVRNVKTNNILVCSPTNGYNRIRLKERKYSALIHRLVLMTFKPIDNYKSLMVNHKDGNRQNNTIENLEWCTQKENIYHSRKITGNGSVISKQRILKIYEANKDISTDDFVKLIVANCN